MERVVVFLWQRFQHFCIVDNDVFTSPVHREDVLAFHGKNVYASTPSIALYIYYMFFFSFLLLRVLYKLNSQL